MNGAISTALAGMEVYTDKAALQRQLDHPDFQKYHETVEKEQLYSSPEVLTAWYPTAGFLAREQTTPKAALVMTAMFFLKDGQESKEKVMGVVKYVTCCYFDRNVLTVLLSGNTRSG